MARGTTFSAPADKGGAYGRSAHARMTDTTVNRPYGLRFHYFCRIFHRVCRYRYFGWRRRDHYHTDQNQQSPQNRSQAKRFAAEEISNQDGHNRIYVRVGADFCRRFMMNQPYVGGITDDGARDNQVEQREPRSTRDARRMKITKFAQRDRRDSQKHSASEHLRSRTHDFRSRHRQLARQHRRYRPTYRRNNQRYGADPIDRRPAAIQRAAHENCHSSNPDQ